MESLSDIQFREVCHAIVEAEDALRQHRTLSLSAEQRLRRQLTVLYDRLTELWPIVPGRGAINEG